MKNPNLKQHLKVTLSDLKKDVETQLDQVSEKYDKFCWETIIKGIDDILEEAEYLLPDE